MSSTPDTPTSVGHEGLRAALARSAERFVRTRVDAQDAEPMLTTIVAGALDAIPAVAAASITLMDRRGTITTHAPSDELVDAVDRVQAELGEGPCVDALKGDGAGITDVTDLAAAPWPRFTPRARDAGFGSVLSFRVVAGGSAGALNLWATAADRFGQDDRLVAALFADQAAVALAGARRVAELNGALAGRDVIGRAKGILMERFRVHDDAAFAMLVESSQTTNIKLVDVAGWLVEDAESRYDRDVR